MATSVEAAGVFVHKLFDRVDDGDCDDALEMLFDDANNAALQQGCMDLFHGFTTRIRQGKLIEDETVWGYVESMLEYMATKCSAKEVLLAVLDLVDDLRPTDDDRPFYVSLRLLGTVLLRLTDTPKCRSGLYFDEVLCAVYGYVRRLPVGDERAIEDERDMTMLMDDCPRWNRVNGCLSAVLDFCQPFLDQVLHCDSTSLQFRLRRRQQLAIFLRQLINYPLSRIELPRCPSNSSYPSDYALTWKRTVDYLADADTTGTTLLTTRQHSQTLTNFSDGHDEDLSDGLLCWAREVQGWWPKGYPICVRSHEFRVESALVHLDRLLLHKHRCTSVYRKALWLLESLFALLQNSHPWPAAVFRDERYSRFLFGLIAVLQRCDVRSVREDALRLLSECLSVTDTRSNAIRPPPMSTDAQHAAILMLFAEINYQSPEKGGYELSNIGNLLGWLIDVYRRQLTHQLQSDEEHRIFVGGVRSALPLFLHLPDGETTDLLDRFEQYLAGLNLVRFLLLKHQIPPDLPFLHQQFLHPLSNALQLSRKAYDGQAKVLKADSKDAKGELSVDDSNRLAVVENAITSCELLQSLLQIVRDLCDSE